MGVHRTGPAQRRRLSVGPAQACEGVTQTGRPVEDRPRAHVDDVRSHVVRQGVEAVLVIGKHDGRHQVVDPHRKDLASVVATEHRRSLAAGSAGRPLRVQ